MNQIVIKGAKENNLKNINLIIPRNKVVCFVGVSGSGKSTVAFDIIAKEGQRQYFESLSSYARRYLQKSNRPLVDEIKGISSTVIISQNRIRGNPRSTVGTITETYTYLRLLYSRVAIPSFDSSYYSFNHPLGACPKCKGLGRAMKIKMDALLDFNKSLNEGAIRYSNWRVGGMVWKIIRATGFFDMDKKVKDFSSKELDLLLYAKKQVPVDKTGLDNIINWSFKGVVTHLNSRGSSTHRFVNDEEMKYFDFIDCPECHGGRLNTKSLEVKLNGKNIGEISNMPLNECLAFVKSIRHKNAVAIKPRLIEQLQFLIDSGVGYLSLNRTTDTLSGGEAQRVKMARQLGCDLVETIYVLDEPSAGLHPKDINIVTKNLLRLKDNGNTVLVVEHDKNIILAADHIIELGPGGGKTGGNVIFNGPKKDFLKSNDSPTAKYLRKKKDLICKRNYRKPQGFLKIRNASRNNLKNLHIDIPTGILVSLTGVSGAGKSSLVEVIVKQYPKKVVLIGQQSIGNNKRGCIATYTGVFDEIRKIFAKNCNVSPSIFSYNSRGRCPECKGLGILEMDMNFLGNIKIKCGKCEGKRYRPEALKFKYRNKNIVDVLEMTAVEAKDFFDEQIIKDRLNLLIDVGLDYIEIGQTLDTLSGGEAQRLKLADRLNRKGELFILDEPTSGLHFADIYKLLKLLNKLVDRGNTVLIVEHNLEVIKNCDWIIDLGPEGGNKGGEIVAQGTPLQVAKYKNSYTGKYLSKEL